MVRRWETTITECLLLGGSGAPSHASHLTSAAIPAIRATMVASSKGAADRFRAPHIERAPPLHDFPMIFLTPGSFRP